MWLRVWDKTREKDGKNEAIYEIHSAIKENIREMHFWAERVQTMLNNIEQGRFWVRTQEDEKALPEETVTLPKRIWDNIPYAFKYWDAKNNKEPPKEQS
jgi:hypothetical protein